MAQQTLKINKIKALCLSFCKIPSLAFLIMILSVGIYFYNFSNRINFGPEQGLSLLVSAEYLHEGFSLLGLPNLQRFTSTHLTLYSGSLFNYTLVPLLFLFQYDPFPITVFFGLVLLLSGLLTVWYASSVFDKKGVIFTALLFFINGIMIWHATFIWILNYLPLIGILSIYALSRAQKNYRYFLWLGFFSGIGFNLQYMYLFTIFALMLYIFLTSQRKYRDLLLFCFGCLLGNAPMVIFDLRNDFFHARSLWQYFLDTLRNPGQGSISYYHFLQFWPAGALMGAWLLEQLEKKARALVYGILVMYCCVNLFSPWVDFTAPVGMPVEMRLSDINAAAAIIADDNPTNFNVSSSVPMDSSRAYPLRYLLAYRLGFQPESVENYASVEKVYGVAEVSSNVLEDGPWEFTAHKPERARFLHSINERFAVFVLE